jgi:hypothetical protein
VQQGKQAGEPFVRMGGVIGPSPEQRPLDGGIKDVAGEGRLAAQPQGDGRVDEDELAALRPAEEAAQHVGSLVAVAVGAVAEECFEVGGGHLGPAAHRPGGCQVDGQVAEDPEPGLHGDVADRVPAGAPGSVPLFELAVVEGGYCGGQAGRDGVEVVAAACRGAALFFVSGQGQAAAGEEPAQGPPGCAAGWFAAVQELRWAGRGVGCQQPSGLAQDLDRAAWMMACRGEGG